ncbi:MAG: hypothetical protein H0T42_05860 [Deltaproteobacteria bacterium]|nr:hypothetical protein [Deltaproteobacteria bacterium]
MAKLGLIASSTLVVGMLAGALTFATVSTVSAPTADAADKCQRSDFKTELVKQACEKGGQKAAKDAMKTWMKEKKLKSCNQCHSKLAPTYELKADAVAQFQKLGGKLLAKTTPAKATVKPAAPTAPAAK